MHSPPFVPHEDRGSLQVPGQCPTVNVAMNERLVSLGVGGVMLLNSLVGPRRSRPLSFLLAAGVLYRGLTGHCHAYEIMGIDSAQAANAKTSIDKDASTATE